MAFNHAKEEKKFKEWKEKEEEVLRSYNFEEKLIAILYQFDRTQFNSNRRFGVHEDTTSDVLFVCTPSYDETEINEFDDILHQLNDEKLCISLIYIDSKLKEIIYLLTEGYTPQEIAKRLGVSCDVIYKKIQRLRKKLKKVSKY